MKEIIIGNDRYTIEESIGKGGEGEVFTVQGSSDLAVKIYNGQLRTNREAKVRAMVKQGLSLQTDLVAYPGEIVTDRAGKFLGFVMRLVTGFQPLHYLYSPKSRQQHFPKADYRFIIRAAVNMARAVGKVHETGCVIGDLNHSGVLVGSDATVALIDADSFQFNAKGKSYPCVVGVPDFTAPELHGQDLASIKRTVQHDDFGLAVAIFHLLFMGRHPYAGRHKGPDISMGDAIAQNRFAFSINRQIETRTLPPPGSLSLTQFPELIAQSFEDAFGLIPTTRPGALEWVRVLTRLESTLKRCSNLETHYYPSQAKKCIWCDLTARNGFEMFLSLSVSGQTVQSDERGTEQAIREILAFRIPKSEDILPSSTLVTSVGSLLNKARISKSRNSAIGIILMIAAIYGLFNFTSLWWIWGGVALFGWFKAVERIDPRPYTEALQQANTQVQRELHEFAVRNGVDEILAVYGNLEKEITAYRKHSESLAQELMKLKSSRESRQRQTYLDRFTIRRANIPGIGQAKTATLISFGIETAGDINRSAVLRVPGIGYAMAGKLLEWRKRHESRFKYDRTPNAQDVADEGRLRNRFAVEKAKRELTIRNGLSTLRNAKTKLSSLQVIAQRDRRLKEAVETKAQAEHNLKALGQPVPVSKFALMISQSAHAKATPSTVIPIKPTRTSTSRTVKIPKCPRCGNTMKKRSGRYGMFWGCPSYPKCRGTRNI